MKFQCCPSPSCQLEPSKPNLSKLVTLTVHKVNIPLYTYTVTEPFEGRTARCTTHAARLGTPSVAPVCVDTYLLKYPTPMGLLLREAGTKDAGYLGQWLPRGVGTQRREPGRVLFGRNAKGLTETQIALVFALVVPTK
mmetsp:Transcript_76356/g.134829  ORF Transcript_76356/g.134829 Transcript_76356/m.134829 type:complete len:138 (-) Transcript_76356:1479-1892(-)